jgi:hypothetical protein
MNVSTRQPHGLWFVLGALMLGLLLGGCDSGDPPEPVGSLIVSVTFPDGSPTRAHAYVTHYDPARPPQQPSLHTASGTINGGSRLFSDLPLGQYIVSITPMPLQHEPEVVGMPSIMTLVGADEPVRIESFVGYRHARDWLAAATLESPERDNPWAAPRGYVQLIRYDPDALRIGSRHDLVRDVRSDENLFVEDEVADEVTIAIYTIPPEYAWGHNDAGDMTYDLFRHQLAPDTSFTVPLEHEGGSAKIGYLSIRLDPAMFFGARNGIAFLAEGQRLYGAHFISEFLLTYVWEEDP